MGAKLMALSLQRYLLWWLNKVVGLNVLYFNQKIIITKDFLEIKTIYRLIGK
jgi:hypothetical protein